MIGLLIKHRQQMDGATRAHKKQMSSLQSMLTDCKHEDRLQSVIKSPTQSPSEINQLLEQGKIHLIPHIDPLSLLILQSTLVDHI